MTLDDMAVILCHLARALDAASCKPPSLSSIGRSLSRGISRSASALRRPGASEERVSINLGASSSSDLAHALDEAATSRWGGFRVLSRAQQPRWMCAWGVGAFALAVSYQGAIRNPRVSKTAVSNTRAVSTAWRVDITQPTDSMRGGAARRACQNR